MNKYFFSYRCPWNFEDFQNVLDWYIILWTFLDVIKEADTKRHKLQKDSLPTSITIIFWHNLQFWKKEQISSAKLSVTVIGVEQFSFKDVEIIWVQKRYGRFALYRVELVLLKGAFWKVKELSNEVQHEVLSQGVSEMQDVKFFAFQARKKIDSFGNFDFGLL